MTDTGATTLLNRTFSRLFGGWRGAAARRALDPSLPDDDAERLRQTMRDCLEGKGGAVSARSRAADLGQAYLSLDETGRWRFLEIVAREFDVDADAVDRAIARLQEATGPIARAAAMADLRACLVPPRVRLLTQFSSLPEGIKFLVELRAELLSMADGDPALGALEADLQQILASWFDVGLLELTRITWDSPAGLLERLIAYEAVHEIRSWTDLKNRLDSDRRCFAFFHPGMAEEPLIFVEVALVNGMADSIQALLDETAPPIEPDGADTAIFYSISNAQRGLDGIRLGDFLIKRVVDALRREFPNLKTFATLSPMPGFRRWLDRRLENEDGDALLSRDNAAVLADLLDKPWPDNPEQADELRGPLLRLGAHYLIKEKRRGRALDPVANFHLTNGARLEGLNWLADTSAKGLRESAGMMVNYLYKLPAIETNHEKYSGEGRVAASARVKGLLKT